MVEPYCFFCIFQLIELWDAYIFGFMPERMKYLKTCRCTRNKFSCSYYSRIYNSSFIWHQYIINTTSHSQFRLTIDDWLKNPSLSEAFSRVGLMRCPIMNRISIINVSYFGMWWIEYGWIHAGSVVLYYQNFAPKLTIYMNYERSCCKWSNWKHP